MPLEARRTADTLVLELQEVGSSLTRSLGTKVGSSVEQEMLLIKKPLYSLSPPFLVEIF